MLNKKSLAVALMGLGLAGSCFAAQNAVEVTFKAKVEAATCSFSVNSGTAATADTSGATEINFGTIKLRNGNPKEAMQFKLDCGSSVPFTSVSIAADSLMNTLPVTQKEVVEQPGTANFKFYNDNAGQLGDVWDGEIASSELAQSGSIFTATKWVVFEMGEDTKAGTYEESVTYTATYE